MLTSRVIAKRLFQLSEEPNIDASRLAHAFLEFVEKHDLQRQLPAITYYLEAEAKRKRKDEQVIYTTAHPVSHQTVEAMKRYIGAHDNTSTVAHMDASLIGGFIARYKGKIYDASMRSQLASLKKMLTSEK
jgi:F0F1-type ATP synthase delta subunit